MVYIDATINRHMESSRQSRYSQKGLNFLVPGRTRTEEHEVVVSRQSLVTGSPIISRKNVLEV